MLIDGLESNILEKYLSWLQQSKKAKNTIDQYLNQLRLLNVPEGSEEAVLTRLSDPSTQGIFIKIAAFRSFLTFLDEYDLIQAKQLKRLQSKAKSIYSSRKKKHLSKKKIAIPQFQWNDYIGKLTNHSPAGGMLLWTLFNYGLRLGEGRNLRDEDLDIANQELIVQVHYKPDFWEPKTQSRRMTMTDYETEVFRRWLNRIKQKPRNNSYLFVDDGKRVNRRTFQYWLKKMGITAHQTRYSYAVFMYEGSGFDLKLVSELLGHADISTTAEYLERGIEFRREKVREIKS